MYRPIDCNFYDRLEALATQRKRVEVVYLNQYAQPVTVFATIADLFTRQKEEFIVLDDGTTFRLDRLVQADGHRLADAACGWGG